MESQSFSGISRRRYSAAFKSRLVALVCEPGASVGEQSLIGNSAASTRTSADSRQKSTSSRSNHVRERWGGGTLTIKTMPHAIKSISIVIYNDSSSPPMP